MGWYDIFSWFYDAAVEKLYRPYRSRLAEACRLEPGDTVLDLACGTGQSFEVLLEAVGPDGRVIGIDGSKGMLKRARKKVRKHGWENVVLIRRSAGELDADALSEARGEASVDAVLVSLGLTAFDGWEAVFESAFDLLAPGGRFVVFDVHAEERTRQTRSVERVARADLSRQVWKPLEAATSDFELEYTDGDPKTFGGRLFIASGTKAS